MSEQKPKPETLLAALFEARRAMPRLPKSDSGVDENGKTFWFPSEEDLRDATDMTLDAFDLMLIPNEACFAATGITLTWTLHHLPSGQERVLKVVWPVFEAQGYLSRAHASGATWSHAWRHLVCKLLEVKTESAPPGSPQAAAEEARRRPASTPRCRDDDLPLWAGDTPPRARTIVPRDAQWVAAGATVEPAPPAPPHEPNTFEPEVMNVWIDLCDAFRKAGVAKRWDSCLVAWKEFAGEGHEHDMLAPNDSAFKRWLVQLANEWIDQKRTSARPT